MPSPSAVPQVHHPAVALPNVTGPQSKGKKAWVPDPEILVLLTPFPMPSACEFGRGSSDASQPFSPRRPPRTGICTPRPRSCRACSPSSARSQASYPRGGPAAPPSSPVLGTLNLQAPGGGCGASDQSRKALAATGPRGGLGGLGGRRGAGLYPESLTAWAAGLPGYAGPCPSTQSCVLCRRPALHSLSRGRHRSGRDAAGRQEPQPRLGKG